jgi:outer membrane autotransporter protein
MKKKVLVFILFLPFLSLKAQIQKGDFLTNATFSFSGTNNSKAKTTNWDLVGLFSYSINPNLVVGIRNALQLSTGYFIRNDGTRNSNDKFNYYIGPNFRYYPLKEKKLLPFAGIGYLMDGNDIGSRGSTGFLLEGGVDYFFTPNFAFEGNLNYSNFSGNSSYDITTFSIGLMYKF